MSQKSFWNKLRDRFSWILGFPAKLDRRLAEWDLRSHRIDETLWHKRHYLEGYSKTAFWLPAVVLYFLAYGLPREFDQPWYTWPWFIISDRGWGLLVAFLGALVAHLLVCRFARGRWLPRLQWLVLVVVALGVFVSAGSAAKQVDAAAYRHILAVFGVLVLTVAMPANRWLAERWVLGWRKKRFATEREAFRGYFADNLDRTQLFVVLPTTEDRWSRVLRALSLVPLTSPVLLIILPALTALVIPRRLLGIGFLVALLASWLGLAAAHYRSRLSAFLEIARQLVVRGAPGVVSAIVILLAVLRLAGVDYVTTVLDQSSKWVLFGFVVMLYYLFWLYEYWSQRALSEVLLGLLHRPRTAGDEAGDRDEVEKDRHPAWVHYPEEGQSRPRNDEEARRRRLQIHGNGRLIAIRERPDREFSREDFQPHPALEVFERIHRQLVGRARLKAGATREKADKVGEEAKKVWEEADKVGDALHDLQQRVRLYRVAPALLLAVVAGWALLNIFTQEQKPGIDARAANERSFRLEPALTAHQQEPEVYAIAASGGGTRAAAYTYSLLRVLRDRDVIDRVVMASGVSGGSLGLAYYAAHRDALHGEPLAASGADGSGGAWARYRAATVAPYIQDVLAGAGEWRFLTGSRLGHLLTEGFERELSPEPGPQVGGEGACGPGRGHDLGSRPEIGLIFNSSLSGLWDPSDRVARECLEKGTPRFFWRGRAKKRDCASVASRGSRVALTNVASFNQPGVGSTFDGWRLDLDYEIVDDPCVSLAQAASVSANFPPIFSNAAIRLRDGGSPEDEDAPGEKRLWVTDGGAVENRGLISLLLALRAEIGSWPEPETPEPGTPGSEALVPAACRLEPTERGEQDTTWIKVIVAEASGGSEGYSEDRGTATALGAAKQIADKLIPELARQVDREYCRRTGGRGRVKIVYLPMPGALARAFGTHWQLLRTTTVSDPDRWYESGRELLKPWTWFVEEPPEITLSGDEVLAVLDHLFASDDERRAIPFADPTAHTYLWDWIGRGADGGADEDPRERLTRELDLAPERTPGHRERAVSAP